MDRREAHRVTDVEDYAAESRPAGTAGARPLKGLLPFLAPHKGLIISALLALLVAAGATLLLPYAVRQMIDLGFSAESSASVDRYFVAMFAVACLLALATAVRFYLVTRLGEAIISDIRKAVFDNVVRMSPAFFEHTRTGEVLSRLTADTTLVHTVVGSSASVALRSVLLLIGAIALMTVTSPLLAAAIAALIPIILVPILLFGRKVRVLSRTSQDRVADFSAMAGEVLNAIPVVQAFTQEQRESERFGVAATDAYVSALKRTTVRALLTAVVIVVVFGGIVAVLWMGAQRVIEGVMTPGELSQFVFYAVIAAGSTGALSEVWGDVQRAGGAMERLLELIGARSEIEAPDQPKPLPEPARGELELDEVTFAYPAHPDRPVLQGFSLHIKPGETVALVGASGAGKSTVFQLILRFYDPQSGEIRFDGLPLKDLKPSDFRRHIALVPQDSVVFAADAISNIRYGKPDADEQQVRRAASLAAADDFLSSQPDGYSTFLGERGLRLSGGQQQRLAVARALIKDAPLLLLDEATSSLDAESERKVQSALETLMQGRTTLVIAHRLATVKQADRIVVLEGGKVVAEGTHEQLYANAGLYQRLAKLQFET